MSYSYLSAIDMGTNSFRLVVARIKEDGTFKIIAKEKELIRLASHKGKGLSIITDEEIKTAIKALKKFKKISGFYNAPVRAVATSAVREAKNRHEFIEQVKEKTGIEVEVIEGHHEAKLIFMGVQSAVSVKNKRAVCFDIGGGSTEFIFAENNSPVYAESIKIGAVRLTKRFFPDFTVDKKSIEKCEQYVEEHIRLNKNINTNEKYDIAIGSSGTILATASLIYFMKNKKQKKTINGLRFSRQKLLEATDYVLSKKTLKERLKIKGLEKKRADIIPAGLIILRKIFQLYDIECMTVSEYALRSGIIIEMLKRQASYNG